MEHFHSKRLKTGHSEQDKVKPSIVFFVASMLQCAQGMIGKFLSPVSTRDQICFVTNVAFVLKIKSVSNRVFKENNAEAGPLDKEKMLEEVSTEKPGKSESKRRRYQTSWEKDFPWLEFEKE